MYHLFLATIKTFWIHFFPFLDQDDDSNDAMVSVLFIVVFHEIVTHPTGNAWLCILYCF